MKLLNAKDYIQTFLKIRTKDGSVIPFELNKPQQRLYDAIKTQWSAGEPVRIIVLKARQMGFSTLTEGIIFFLTATKRFVESMIVAHKDDSTANLFRMSKRFYDYLPGPIKPMLRASNAQELVFDKPAKAKADVKGLGSRIRCATAGGQGVGRSYTLSCLHLSEFAFWPGDKRETFTGLVQAVPDKPGTLIVIESTANGYDEFKSMWDQAVQAQRDGTDGFTPIFFAWFEMEEYRRTPLPGFERTQEEEELAKTFGLDDEQLAWRRWCIATQCGGDINLFHQEYPSTPDEAFIATGTCVFDKQALVLRREQVRNEVFERGRFLAYDQMGTRYDPEKSIGSISKFEWKQDESGPIRIRKAPEQGVPYVIGGDTAGTGSDSFVGQVLDNRTGEQVAVLQHKLGEREYAVQMYCMAMYYNEALIGIETNYSTYPQMKLEELGYRNFYVRQKMDTYTGKLVDAFGFETNASTRPVVIDNLKDVAKYSLELICDYETLGEMLTFIYNEKYRPEAEQGEHDDLVMALAIAHFIRTQQRTSKALPPPEKRKWTKDMREDYRKASAAEREYLRKKWGDPE